MIDEWMHYMYVYNSSLLLWVTFQAQFYKWTITVDDGPNHGGSDFCVYSHFFATRLIMIDNLGRTGRQLL